MAGLHAGDARTSREGVQTDSLSQEQLASLSPNDSNFRLGVGWYDRPLGHEPLNGAAGVFEHFLEEWHASENAL